MTEPLLDPNQRAAPADPTPAALLRRIRECMQAVLELSDAEAAGVDSKTTPLAVPRWTSLAHVQLILELERTFGVIFDADEIAELASVRAIMDALTRPRA